MMTPKMPSADPKISTMRIFTKSDASCASASAQPLPATPTQILSKSGQPWGGGSRAPKSRNPHPPASKVSQPNTDATPEAGVASKKCHVAPPLEQCRVRRQTRRRKLHLQG